MANDLFKEEREINNLTGWFIIKETEFELQFLGINFKFDDILILFVLYILYMEHIENNSLFIILFMLLFS